MTEHEMLLRVQKKLDGLKAQVAGLVIERDALLSEVAEISAERDALREFVASLKPEAEVDYGV